MATSLIGVGANLGDRLQTLEQAVELLARHPQVHVAARSAWHATAAIGGPPGQQPFLNGALRLETSLTPRQLHTLLRETESRLGRVRSQRWGPRLLDLDLLLYEDLALDEPDLAVPHPRMALRRFVLEPAAEVAPDMVHPTIGWTVGQLLEHLNTALPYAAIAGAAPAASTAFAEKVSSASGAKLISSRREPLDAAPVGELRTGRLQQAEIELLRGRAELLSRALWQADAAWSVSDFWFDESLAFAKALLNDREARAVRDVWESLRSGVVPPKLVMVIEPPASAATSRRALQQVLHDHLLGLATGPAVGPVLHLPAADLSQAAAECAAALEAMK